MTIATTLKNSAAKGRQESLEYLSNSHDPLHAYLGLKNGSLTLEVGKTASKIVSTVDSKIVRQIEARYAKSNGLKCKIEIGGRYRIMKIMEGHYACEVTLTVIPT